jgi:MraZ protein
MAQTAELFLGEWVRSLDERHRLSLPAEWAEQLVDASGECTLAKERPGCVSLWNTQHWQSWLASGVDLLQTKIRGGRLGGRVDEVQRLGRLLSTRHHTATIAGRGRLAVPDSFRAFLGVEAGGEVLVVGAAVCVEVWNLERWGEHIAQDMPEFRKLFDELTK